MIEDPGRVITRMFSVIDARSWDAFEEIFDPAIAYCRPGYPPIVGLERLLRFYCSERIIARGAHRLESVIVGPSGELASWGHFVGVTREGVEVTEDFSEIYHISAGLMMSRRTFFYRPAI